MSSIIDMVAKAEEEAAAIRTQGASAAKARVAQANAEAQGRLDAAKESARDYAQKRREQSDRQGRRVYLEIQSVKLKETDLFCSNAAGNLNAAVAYIVERVTK